MLWNIVAVESAGAILKDAALTIVIGFTVVFCVLLLLTGIFKAFGVAMEKLQSKEKVEKVPVIQEKVQPVAEVADIGPVLSQAQIRNGISDEQAAVIATAVAMSMPAGEKFTIKKIDLAD